MLLSKLVHCSLLSCDVVKLSKQTDRQTDRQSDTGTLGKNLKNASKVISSQINVGPPGAQFSMMTHKQTHKVSAVIAGNINKIKSTV